MKLKYIKKTLCGEKKYNFEHRLLTINMNSKIVNIKVLIKYKINASISLVNT